MTETASALASAAPLTPDICVIGAGAGGISVATAAALFGVSVVLVERARLGGGMDASAVPSGALFAAARSMRTVSEARHFGVAAGEPQVDYARLRDHFAHVGRVTAANHSIERLAALGIVVIEGEARFRNRHTVAVGERLIKARRFVVATGSRPAVPPIPGLAELSFLTEETIFALPRLPERLLVLGGEPTGVAIAQAMRRLGSEVALVAPRGLLPDEDAEAVALVRRALLRERIALHEETTILRAEAFRHRPRLVIAAAAGSAETMIEGSHLLVAAGRAPNLEQLDLDLAGINSDEGGIVVDRGLRTVNRRVYALGDCAGGAVAGRRFAHAAQHHAGLVVRNALFRLPVRVAVSSIPRVSHCQPEVASVGLSEVEARKRGAINVLRWPYAENDRAQAERRSEGLIKLVSDRKGRILGVTIAGAQAAELIAPWCLAVQKGFKVADMADLVLPYPSLSEISKRVALSSYAPLAARPGIRRLIGFLRRFG